MGAPTKRSTRERGPGGLSSTRRSWLVSLWLVSLSLAGCGGVGALAGEAGGALPEPVIEETLRTLDDEETQRQIIELLRRPGVQEATRELVANITDGTLDALSEEERAARITELADAFVLRIADAVERDIGPAMTRAVAETLEESLRRALSEENAAALSETVTGIARQSTAALAVAVREELGPAMRDAFRDALDDPETRALISDASRVIARAMVLGVQDGFEEIEERAGPHQTDTVVTRLQEMAGEGFDLGQLLLFLILLAMLAVVIYLARSVVKERRGEAEAESREAALATLIAAIKSTEGRPWSPELTEMLQASLKDDEPSVYLRELLRKSSGDTAGSRRGDRSGGTPSGPLETA